MSVWRGQKRQQQKLERPERMWSPVRRQVARWALREVQLLARRLKAPQPVQQAVQSRASLRPFCTDSSDLHHRIHLTRHWLIAVSAKEATNPSDGDNQLVEDFGKDGQNLALDRPAEA